jgi:hypothetical protein
MRGLFLLPVLAAVAVTAVLVVIVLAVVLSNRKDPDEE